MGGSWGIDLRLCIVCHKPISTLLTEQFTDVTLFRLFPFKQKNYSCGFYLHRAHRNKCTFHNLDHLNKIKSCIIFKDPQPTHPCQYDNLLILLTCNKRIISLQWPESFLRKIVLRILTKREDTLKKTNKTLLDSLRQNSKGHTR